MVKNVVFKGPVFHSTGVAGANRKLLSELKKDARVGDIQFMDYYRKSFDPEGILVSDCVDIESKDTVIVFAGHPRNALDDSHGDMSRRVGMFVHEGTKLPADWVQLINHSMSRVAVPSREVKNLFASSGVRIPIYVVPHGVDCDVFSPKTKPAELAINPELKVDNPFILFSVGAWDGALDERKGTADLLRAFCEEFSREENILLYLRTGGAWIKPFDMKASIDAMQLPTARGKFIIEDSIVSDNLIPGTYTAVDCFVTATRGEGWGLPISEAMASGLPIILPENKDAAYNSFTHKDCRINWVKVGDKVQADPRFFVEGNLMPKVDLMDLRRAMREEFELWKANKLDYKSRALINRDYVNSVIPWSNAVESFVKFIEGDN